MGLRQDFDQARNVTAFNLFSLDPTKLDRAALAYASGVSGVLGLPTDKEILDLRKKKEFQEELVNIAIAAAIEAAYQAFLETFKTAEQFYETAWDRLDRMEARIQSEIDAIQGKLPHERTAEDKEQLSDLTGLMERIEQTRRELNEDWRATKADKDLVNEDKTEAPGATDRVKDRVEEGKKSLDDLEQKFMEAEKHMKSEYGESKDQNAEQTTLANWSTAPLQRPF